MRIYVSGGEVYPCMVSGRNIVDMCKNDMALYLTSSLRMPYNLRNLPTSHIYICIYIYMSERDDICPDIGGCVCIYVCVKGRGR